MITAFNRKALAEDTNAEAIAAIWSRLKANGIPYRVVTKTVSSSINKMNAHRSNMGFYAGGVPASWTDQASKYVYIVYVCKKDYESAKELCDL